MADVTAEGQRGGETRATGTPVRAGGTVASWMAAAGSGSRGLLAANWPFALVMTVAAALRCVVLLGYPPVLWYSDSYNYIADAVTGRPDVVRSNGYPFFLRVLLPLHSLTLVAILQALMGLATGVAIYAALRKRGLPWWGAALPAVPVLFDVYELQLEHMVMSDVLFVFLVTVAVAALCRRDRPSVLVCVIAGLLVGYADLVRSVGIPLLVVMAGCLLLRRVNWKPVVALLAAGLIPVIGYMAWYHAYYGQYALAGSSGTFLYSRVSSFARCQQINPPRDLRVLCDPRPPAQRGNSQQYLWSTRTPLYRITKGHQFSEWADSMAGKFAKDAITAEPLDYLQVVASDTGRTFTWTRTQSDVTGSGPSFQFRPELTPVWRSKKLWWVNYYPVDKAAAHRYGGPGEGQPRVVQPWAGLIQGYQRYFYLRGTILAVIVVIGAAGIAARWRRWGGLALMPWLAGACLIVLPPMTAGFSYRYILAAVPVTCLAAGLALSREPRGKRPARHRFEAAARQEQAPSRAG